VSSYFFFSFFEYEYYITISIIEEIDAINQWFSEFSFFFFFENFAARAGIGELSGQKCCWIKLFYSFLYRYGQVSMPEVALICPCF
jgi:hypothetical protein